MNCFNPFPRPTNLQQTTFKTSGEKKWKNNNVKEELLNEVENIVPFSPLVLMFFENLSEGEASKWIYMWERVYLTPVFCLLCSE